MIIKLLDYVYKLNSDSSVHGITLQVSCLTMIPIVT